MHFFLLPENLFFIAIHKDMLKMAAPEVDTAMTKPTLQEQQKCSPSPRMRLLHKTHRTAQKTIGFMMQSLRLTPSNRSSSNRSSKTSCALLEVNVEIPSPKHIQLPTATLETSIKLLSSPNANDNHKGLQLLITLTKANKIVSSPRTNISQRIVTGGSDRAANRLRTLLLSFLCNNVDITAIPEHTDDDSSEISALSDAFFGTVETCDDSDSDSDDDEEGKDDERPPGRHWGSLHCLALRVLVSCLEQFATSPGSSAKKTKSIDYSSTFWANVVQTLSRNLENTNNLDVCGCSLRCLYLLVTLDDAGIIVPMLKYTLLPYIMNLQECGDTLNDAMVTNEATKLLTHLL